MLLSFSAAIAQPVVFDGVIGQDGVFGTRNSSPVSNRTVQTPKSLFCSQLGDLFVVHGASHRVTRYPAAQLDTPTPVADAVWGQPDMQSSSQGVGPNSLRSPWGIVLDKGARHGWCPRVHTPSLTLLCRLASPGGRFRQQSRGGLASIHRIPVQSIVCLWSRQRCQQIQHIHCQLSQWNSICNWATVSFPSGVFFGLLTLWARSPQSAAVDSQGGTWIIEFDNNRAVYYDPGLTSASFVRGQASFADSLPNRGGVPGANTLKNPEGACIDASDNLIIADGGNHRALLWPSASMVAIRVYGQSDFASSTAVMIATAQSLNRPSSCAFDVAQNLYIADSGNNRILRYAPGVTTATFVIGQPDFGSSSNGLSYEEAGLFFLFDVHSDLASRQTQLFFPSAVTICPSGNIFISERWVERLIRQLIIILTLLKHQQSCCACWAQSTCGFLKWHCSRHDYWLSSCAPRRQHYSLWLSEHYGRLDCVWEPRDCFWSNCCCPRICPHSRLAHCLELPQHALCDQQRILYCGSGCDVYPCRHFYCSGEHLCDYCGCAIHLFWWRDIAAQSCNRCV